MCTHKRESARTCTNWCDRLREEERPIKKLSEKDSKLQCFAHLVAVIFVAVIFVAVIVVAVIFVAVG